MDQTTLEKLKTESEELADKLEKLDSYIASKQYKILSYTNQRLLEQQRTAMEAYLAILYCRIEINTEA